MEIPEWGFKVVVKVNASKNEILGYDAVKKVYKVGLKEKPIEGEANKELQRFLSKELKKRVRIVSGLRSREKMIEVF